MAPISGFTETQFRSLIIKKQATLTDEDFETLFNETEHLEQELSSFYNKLRKKAKGDLELQTQFNYCKYIVSRLQEYIGLLEDIYQRFFTSLGCKCPPKIIVLYEEKLGVIVTKLKSIDNSFVKFFDINDLLNEIIIIYSHIETTGCDQTSWQRVEIYKHYRDRYIETKLQQDLVKLSQYENGYFEKLYVKRTSSNLRDFHFHIEAKMQQYALCRVWAENQFECEEYMVGELSKLEASVSDYDNLFKYQFWNEQIQKQIGECWERETHGDKVFVHWVDPIELAGYLEHWINANIDKSKKWYVVYCLMKYTFGVLKDNVNKGMFSKRMNMMFPKAGCKCIENSFRQYEYISNHNQPFSEWQPFDPDYKLAQSFYDKLCKKEMYSRNE